MNLGMLWEWVEQNEVGKRRGSNSSSISSYAVDGMMVSGQTDSHRLNNHVSPNHMDTTGAAISHYKNVSRMIKPKWIAKNEFSLDYEATAIQMSSKKFDETPQVKSLLHTHEAEAQDGPVNKGKHTRSKSNKKSTRARDNTKKNKEMESSSSSMPGPSSSSVDSSTKSKMKPYHGDMFGTRGNYVNGMLYLSRINKHGGASKEKRDIKDQMTTQEKTIPKEAKIMEVDTEEKSSEVVSNESHRRFAETLGNWSSNAANAQQMVEEGAIEALIDLCKKSNDAIVKSSCVFAFKNLSDHSVICHKMIASGAVSIIQQLAFSLEDEKDQERCAQLISNLSCIEGAERQIVREGALSALMNLMGRNEKLSSICQWSMYNLTCVNETFPEMDRVINAFISLANSGQPGTREVCSQAFCNLSKLPTSRVQMVMEGAMLAIISLVRSKDEAIRKSIAATLCNLSLTKDCRSEMVVKGAVSVINMLSSMIHPNVQYWLLMTLVNLSCEPINRMRIIMEDALVVISTIHETNRTPEITQLSALTLYKISENVDVHERMVERKGIKLLHRLSLSNDRRTKELCTLTMCNLLTIQTAVEEILALGAVDALIDLSFSTNVHTMKACACALYHLCTSNVVVDAVRKFGVIPAIMRLSEAKSVQVKSKCAASFWKLSLNDFTRYMMFHSKAVVSLVKLVRSDIRHPLIERYCTGALCILSQNEECADCIVQEGAVDPLIKATESHDAETKYSAAAVLSSLTFHAVNRKTLVNGGIIKSISRLAKVPDQEMQRGCAVALGNLSCEEDLHKALIDGNAIRILGDLSNSYSEENQKDCAKAFCNLSSSFGNEKVLVEQGAIGIIMMIGMVRSVNSITKETCLRAFYNLVNDSTMLAVIREGIIEAIITMAALGTEDAMYTCSLLFAKICTNSVGRKALCNKKAAIQTLFSLLSVPESLETKEVIVQLIYQLICNEDSQLTVVKAGAINTLKDLAFARDSNSTGTERVANAFYILSCKKESRMACLQYGAQPVLVLLLQSNIPAVKLLILKAIRNMARCNETSTRLIGDEIIPPLIEIAALVSTLPEDAAKICTETLCALSFHPDHASTMLHANVLSAMKEMVLVDEAWQELLKGVNILLHELARQASMSSSSSDAFSDVIKTLMPVLVPKLKDKDSMETCADTLYNLAQIESMWVHIVTQECVDIIKHMLTFQAPEVNWRIMTTLRIASARIDLVKIAVNLHMTKLIVAVAHASRDHLNTLHECAFCLALFSSEVEGRSQMVNDGAVSALIALLKWVVLKEASSACSIALSNLSTASPSLEQGSVAALIQMSIHASVDTTTPLLTSNDSLNVLHELYKRFGPPSLVERGRPGPLDDVIPKVESLDEGTKKEAVVIAKLTSNLGASTPPPPHVPDLGSMADEVDDTIGNNASMATDDTSLAETNDNRMISISIDMNEQPLVHPKSIPRIKSSQSDDQEDDEDVDMDEHKNSVVALTSPSRSLEKTNNRMDLYRSNSVHNMRAAGYGLDGNNPSMSTLETFAAAPQKDGNSDRSSSSLNKRGSKVLLGNKRRSIVDHSLGRHKSVADLPTASVLANKPTEKSLDGIRQHASQLGLYK